LFSASLRISSDFVIDRVPFRVPEPLFLTSRSPENR